jgi:Outer membrane protein beta-barrel domain
LQNVRAQGNIGFKVGLNFASIDGPSDVDASGKSLESWSNTTGFHIGVTYTYKITDAFKVRAEGLYSKKGGEYKHEGQMHRTFYTNGQKILTKGSGLYLVKISNSYFEVPLQAVFRFKKFEVSGGAYGGILGVSKGEGALTYSGATANGTTTGQLDFLLDHDYFADIIGGFTPGSATLTTVLDGKSYGIAKTQGAYYDTEVGGVDKYFNRLDAGLIGGAAYYFNSSLYLGLRYQYGLLDLTNDAGHLSIANLTTDSKPLPRNTFDRNITLQGTVGFSF